MSFTIATIEAAAVGFGTFNSLNPKMARLPSGHIVMSYLTSENTAYTAQNIRVDLLNPDFSLRTRLWESVQPANAPSVQATATGEVWISYCDHVNGVANVARWTDPLNAPTVKTWFSATMVSAGKFSSAWDEGRRCLFFIGNGAASLLRFEENGVVTTIPLFSGGTDPLEYPHLSINRDSRLDLAWVTVGLGGAAPHYKGPFYMVSAPTLKGPNYAAGSYFAACLSSSWLTLPMAPDDVGGALRVAPDEVQTTNIFMSSFLADDEALHFVCFDAPGLAERAFLKPERAGLAYYKMSRRTGARLRWQRPLRGETIVPKQAGSGGSLLCRRGSKLYLICASGNQLQALVSRDDGETWRDYAAYSDPEWCAPGWLNTHCLYTVGGDRGRETDPDIIGSFSVVSESCQSWATGTVDPGAATMAFRLSIE